MLEDDELKAVQIESNHTIDIERFVPSSEIDKLYLDTPYYLAPTDRVGEEAFAVIREAMRTEKVVGLARAVLFRRERVLKLEPRGKGIVATSLHFANEVHASDGYFDEIPDLELPKEMLELAKHIIAKMSGKFEPEQFEDRYENALDRADPLQAEGHADQAAADASQHQRHQPDGCAAPQRRGRDQGRAKSAPSSRSKPEAKKAESKPPESQAAEGRAQGQDAHEEGGLTW